MFPLPETHELTCDDLAALRENGAPFRLVDCREEEEWGICRIEGAELHPLSSFAQDAPRKFTDAEEHVIVYCHHGMRSLQATHFLRQKGVKNCWSLQGGIDAWADEQDPAMARY
jgi:adenylyltransferase/sulfurtransferase